MRQREFFLNLDESTIIYVYMETERGLVKCFVVKLMSSFGVREDWYEVIRYDSGHDCPHKDILNTDGEVIRKVWYDFLDNSQALTLAIKDIKENYEFYRERYKKWLKGQ